MDRRTILTILVCFFVFLAWQKYFIEPQMPKQPQTKAALQVEDPQPQKIEETKQTIKQTMTKAEATLSPAIKMVDEGEKIISVSTGTARIGKQNKIVSDWALQDYRVEIDKNASNINLKTVTFQNSQGEIAFDSQEFAYLDGVVGSISKIEGGVLWYYEDEKIKLTRETKTPAGTPFVDFKIRAEFKAEKPNYAFLSLILEGPAEDEEEIDRQLVYWTNNEITRVGIGEVKEIKDVSTPLKWVGVTSRYFVMSLVSQNEVEPKGLVQPLGPKKARVSLVYPVTEQAITLPVRAYFGPKELNTLRAVEPTLDHTVDFGWFTVFAYPLLKLLKWFYDLFHNYGVSIILLTLVVKILTYPLTYKSMKSMKEMAKIQPQLQKVREKYKDNPEALNREMMTLMKSHGYNPLAGCLPILVQMPIFFALYRVLYGAIELYQAPFVFWIADLSSKDPYYVTPVLLTLTMYIQQKITPTTATDPMQAKMLQFMPVLFGLFMLALPSGLTIYMLVNALASIVQQFIMNKKLNITNVPVATARAR